MEEYYLLVAGCRLSGKSSYIKHLSSGKFTSTYTPTLRIPTTTVTCNGMAVHLTEIPSCITDEQTIDYLCAGTQGIIILYNQHAPYTSVPVAMAWKNRADRYNLKYVIVSTHNDIGSSLQCSTLDNESIGISCRDNINIKLPIMSLIEKIKHS